MSDFMILLGLQWTVTNAYKYWQELVSSNTFVMNKVIPFIHSIVPIIWWMGIRKKMLNRCIDLPTCKDTEKCNFHVCGDYIITPLAFL